MLDSETGVQFFWNDFFFLDVYWPYGISYGYAASGAELSQYIRERVSCRPIMSIVILAELQQASSSYI